jgi:hypothetical protein
MKSIAKDIKLVYREDKQWERIVMAEVIVPNAPNVFNDYWTPEAVREAAYMFMKKGFGIDIEHDNNDISERAVYLVESFIARPGDPDFIEGSWVVGMYIADDAIWQDVLDGEINGYSYEAIVEFISAQIEYTETWIRQGTTEPDVNDGHTHEFLVIVDENNRPVSGGTSETNGHSHDIVTHTITEEADGHKHRFNIITGQEFEDD